MLTGSEPEEVLLSYFTAKAAQITTQLTEAKEKTLKCEREINKAHEKAMNTDGEWKAYWIDEEQYLRREKKYLMGDVEYVRKELVYLFKTEAPILLSKGKLVLLNHFEYKNII